MLSPSSDVALADTGARAKKKERRENREGKERGERKKLKKEEKRLRSLPRNKLIQYSPSSDFCRNFSAPRQGCLGERQPFERLNVKVKLYLGSFRLNAFSEYLNKD